MRNETFGSVPKVFFVMEKLFISAAYRGWNGEISARLWTKNKTKCVQAIWRVYKTLQSSVISKKTLETLYLQSSNSSKSQLAFKLGISANDVRT
jgi:hypothetical protein